MPNCLLDEDPPTHNLSLAMIQKKVTGKDDYQVGDVSKKVLQEAKNMLGIGKPPKSSKPAATNSVSSTSSPPPAAKTDTAASTEGSSSTSP